MKQLITNYTFTPGAANTGTLQIPGNYSLEQLQLVTNVTDNIIIYNFADPEAGAARSFSSNVTTFTFKANTSGQSSGDKLQIFLFDTGDLSVDTGLLQGVTNDELRASPINVAATNLDVRDLAFSTDKVDVTGSTVTLDSTSLAALENITVNLSNSSLEIANDAGNPVPVSGTVNTGLSQPLTDTQLRASALVISDGGSSLTVDGTVELGSTSLAALETITVSSVTGAVEITNDGGNAIPISASSLPLPSGAATSANQVTANSSLSSINTKLPSLGQALAGASVPVVLTADQVTALTPPTTVTANTGLTQPLTNTELRATAVTTTVNNFPSIQASSQSGTWNINNISGIISLPTGAATAAKQPALGTAGTPSADVISVQGVTSGVALKVDGSAVTQPVSFGSLPTGSNTIGAISNTGFSVNNFPSTQTVAGTVTANIGTVSTLATAANQSTLIGHVDGIEGLLTTIDADTSTLSSAVTNSKVQADIVSLPTVNVSDNGGSLTVDGTVELGATSLAVLESINVNVTNTSTEITNDAGNPIPVSGTITANTGLSQPLTDTQLRASAVTTTVDNFPTTQIITGTVTANIGTVSTLATATNQSTANASLSNIDGKIPALGQALNSSSVPVVLTASQLTSLTPLSIVNTRSTSFQSVINITRPSDTNPYLAGDVIGDTSGSAIITFTSIGNTDGWIMLTRASLSIANTAIPSGMTGFNLHLFNASPNAIADNAPREGHANDRTKFLRSITFYVEDRGNYLSAVASLNPNDFHIKLTGTSLFGILETLGAHTPVSGTIYTLLLNSMEV